MMEQEPFDKGEFAFREAEFTDVELAASSEAVDDLRIAALKLLAHEDALTETRYTYYTDVGRLSLSSQMLESDATYFRLGLEVTATLDNTQEQTVLLSCTLDDNDRLVGKTPRYPSEHERKAAYDRVGQICQLIKQRPELTGNEQAMLRYIMLIAEGLAYDDTELLERLKADDAAALFAEAVRGSIYLRAREASIHTTSRRLIETPSYLLEISDFLVTYEGGEEQAVPEQAVLAVRLYDSNMANGLHFEQTVDGSYYTYLTGHNAPAAQERFDPVDYLPLESHVKLLMDYLDAHREQMETAETDGQDDSETEIVSHGRAIDGLIAICEAELANDDYTQAAKESFNNLKIAFESRYSLRGQPLEIGDRYITDYNESFYRHIYHSSIIMQDPYLVIPLNHEAEEEGEENEQCYISVNGSNDWSLVYIDIVPAQFDDRHDNLYTGPYILCGLFLENSSPGLPAGRYLALLPLKYNKPSPYHNFQALN